MDSAPSDRLGGLDRHGSAGPADVRTEPVRPGDVRGPDVRSGEARPADARSDAPGSFLSLKILVAGGFGVGKTTLVGSVSEIRPLRTEEQLTEAGRPVDDLGGVERKTTTTVAMDFGRITLRDELSLYLFGTPGQDRFWFLWDELAQGALGAMVLADTRRLQDCFPAVDYFERRDIPFVVAVNCFAGFHIYAPQDVRRALDLAPDTPVVLCDARERESAKEVLIALVEHASRVYSDALQGSSN